MAKRPSLIEVSSKTDYTNLNTNFNRIEEAFDNLVSRDGSAPNQMDADLDLNSNDILNAKQVDAQVVKINGRIVNDSTFGVDPGEAYFSYPTVTDLLASTAVARGVGAIWEGGGFRYQEASASATDHHVTTAGGVKLYEIGPNFSSAERFAETVAREDTWPANSTVFCGDRMFVKDGGSVADPVIAGWTEIVLGAVLEADVIAARDAALAAQALAEAAQDAAEAAEVAAEVAVDQVLTGTTGQSVRALTNTIFRYNGVYILNGKMSENASYTSTDFLCVAFSESINITDCGWTGVTPVAYFDQDFKYLGEEATGLTTATILKADFPAGTFWIKANALRWNIGVGTYFPQVDFANTLHGMYQQFSDLRRGLVTRANLIDPATMSNVSVPTETLTDRIGTAATMFAAPVYRFDISSSSLVFRDSSVTIPAGVYSASYVVETSSSLSNFYLRFTGSNGTHLQFLNSPRSDIVDIGGGWRWVSQVFEVTDADITSLGGSIASCSIIIASPFTGGVSQIWLVAGGEVPRPQLLADLPAMVDNVVRNNVRSDIKDRLTVSTNRSTWLGDDGWLTVPTSATSSSYWGYSTPSDSVPRDLIIRLECETNPSGFTVARDGGSTLATPVWQAEGDIYVFEATLALASDVASVFLLGPSVTPGADIRIRIAELATYRTESIAKTLNNHEARVADLEAGAEEYTIVTANSDAGSGADFTGNTAIQDAIDSITDASPANQYIIKVSGHFEFTVPADYRFRAGLGQYSAIWTKDYVHLEGDGGPDQAVVRGSLDDSLATVQAEEPSFIASDYGIYQPAWLFSRSWVRGITFIARNVRYPLHLDSSPENSIQDVTDCRLIHEGKFGDAVGTIGGGPSGIGVASGQTLVLERTLLQGPSGIFHHNTTSQAKPSKMRFKDCTIINTAPTIANENYVNVRDSGQPCVAEYINCNLTGWTSIVVSNSVSATSPADHLTTSIVMTDQEPMPIYQECNAIALRIRSKATSGTSTVRIDETSSAFEGIFGLASKTLLHENRYFRQSQYGLQWKDGGNGQRGELLTYFDIAEYAIDGNYVTALGKRLGDCSSVNKELDIEIDGTPYTVTFDKNYNGTAATVLPNYSNADIIAEIVAVIGTVADVDTYKTSFDYYPQFAKMGVSINTDSVALEVGMGVIVNGPSMRRATNSDNRIDGICLDPAAVGQKARFIRAGEISRNSGARFILRSAGSDTDPAIRYEWGISTTTPGVFDVAASPKVLRVADRGFAARIIR